MDPGGVPIPSCLPWVASLSEALQTDTEAQTSSETHRPTAHIVSVSSTLNFVEQWTSFVGRSELPHTGREGWRILATDAGFEEWCSVRFSTTAVTEELWWSCTCRSQSTRVSAGRLLRLPARALAACTKTSGDLPSGLSRPATSLPLLLWASSCVSRSSHLHLLTSHPLSLGAEMELHLRFRPLLHTYTVTCRPPPRSHVGAAGRRCAATGCPSSRQIWTPPASSSRVDPHHSLS